MEHNILIETTGSGENSTEEVISGYKIGEEGIGKNEITDKEINKNKINEKEINEKEINEKALAEDKINEKVIHQSEISKKEIIDEDLYQKKITEKEINESKIRKKKINEKNVYEKEIDEKEIYEKSIAENEINEKEIHKTEISKKEIIDDELNQKKITEKGINETEINECEISEKEINEKEINEKKMNEKAINQKEIIAKEIIEKEPTKQNKIDQKDISKKKLNEEGFNEKGINENELNEKGMSEKEISEKKITKETLNDKQTNDKITDKVQTRKKINEEKLNEGQLYEEEIDEKEMIEEAIYKEEINEENINRNELNKKKRCDKTTNEEKTYKNEKNKNNIVVKILNEGELHKEKINEEEINEEDISEEKINEENINEEDISEEDICKEEIKKKDKNEEKINEIAINGEKTVEKTDEESLHRTTKKINTKTLNKEEFIEEKINEEEMKVDLCEKEIKIEDINVEKINEIPVNDKNIVEEKTDEEFLLPTTKEINNRTLNEEGCSKEKISDEEINEEYISEEEKEEDDICKEEIKKEDINEDTITEIAINDKNTVEEKWDEKFSLQTTKKINEKILNEEESSKDVVNNEEINEIDISEEEMREEDISEEKIKKGDINEKEVNDIKIITEKTDEEGKIMGKTLNETESYEKVVNGGTTNREKTNEKKHEKKRNPEEMGKETTNKEKSHNKKRKDELPTLVSTDSVFSVEEMQSFEGLRYLFLVVDSLFSAEESKPGEYPYTNIRCDRETKPKIDLELTAEHPNPEKYPYIDIDSNTEIEAEVDERQDIQKKTFTKWINSHLGKTQCPQINDLFTDLRDGNRLLALLSVLTQSQLKPEKGRMRVHHINNVNKVLQVIQEHGVKLVNISSDDIVGGNQKLTLGLIWLIALQFNGQSLVKSHSVNGIEKSLLAWARQFTMTRGLDVTDFSKSWTDGRAFLMILDANLDDIDLSIALTKHPLARLNTAFDLAHTYFRIEKLLDAEDVHTHKPDHKSIQMYVMCLYHAIETRRSQERTDSDGETVAFDEKAEEVLPPSVNITDLDEVPLDSAEEVYSDKSSTPGSLDGGKKVDADVTHSIMDIEIDGNKIDYAHLHDKSRPLSTATNASVEISTYQAALEAVLTLLLEDEQILSHNLPEPHDFLSAKMQFHENEHFMLKLTEHQQYVGEALEEGSNLISESQKHSGLSVEDQNEVRQQMVLLNERWETLRLRALSVQSSILMRLAEFQTKQIEKLRLFLTSVEDRISHMTDIGTSLPELQQQLIDAHNLKTDLHAQKSLVDSLGNMVVIINDESGNFCDLEDKLTALGERWSHVIKWSDLRIEKLQQYKSIHRWLNTREQDLKAMESKDVLDLGSITKRINDLNYCAKDLLELERYLNDLRQMISTCPQENTNSTERVLVQLENFEDRLEALKQIVEVQTVRIEEKGFKFGRDRASYDESRALRPDGWTDFQMIIKFGEEESEEDETEIENNVSAQNGTSLLSKKRKLRNTDNFYLLDERINEAFLFLDDIEDRLQSLQRQSLREQSAIVCEVQNELYDRTNMAQELKQLFHFCEQEEPSRNLIMEATHIRVIDERYMKLKSRTSVLSTETTHMLTREKFNNSLTGFKLVLADSRDWYSQHASTASKTDLEQRLSDMESLSTEITAAKQSAAIMGDEMLEWKQDFNIFYDSWNDMKRAIITLIREKGGIDEVNQRLQLLEEFVTKVAKAQVLVDDLEPMQVQQKALNNLLDELENLKIDYDFVYLRRPDAITTEFAENWAKVPEYLNERIIKQTTAIENLNHFTAEYNAIIVVLRKLESTLKQDEDTLNAQNSEMDNQRFNMELRKIEIDVISARNFSEIIIKDAENTHRTHLLNQIKELNEFFTNVQTLHKDYIQKRTQILAKTEEIVDRLNKTESWLNELEINTPKTKISDIMNSNELFQIKSKFQTLKETCERETDNFRELNDHGGDILLQIDELKSTGEEKVDSEYALLTKKVTRLNARWTQVTELVYAKTALLEHISTQLGEFKKFMVSETGYLDRLENKIRSTPENADAEEIIEELDDLENVLRAHSDEWLEKIQEIGSELIENEFMANSIREEIDTIVERWTQLQHKAKQRTEILEKEVSEAEQSEKCIVQFEAWLTRVDEILSEHLENDVTIEDLPEEFQRLVKEFDVNEKSFKEIEDVIMELTRNGKVEAANRLQEQLNLMELRFKACQIKLNKCTAPQPAYESRLNRAVAELRNVERSTLVLDVASAGPSTVQIQYQKCLQIYRTLSEIKSEIESTIKTGRKVCEDKFTKSPKHLSQRIDALKHLYNALGENVTQSKIFLETLLKLAHQLDDCFDSAEQLILRFEALQEMHERNTVFLDLEDVLQKCEDIYEEYRQSCDQTCMEDTRKRIDKLKATYLKHTSADVIKRLTEMKTTLQNLDNISLETLRAMEHDLKQINVPSNPEIENLQQQVIAIVVDAFKTIFDEASTLEADLPAESSVKTHTNLDEDTEIVIVSDTVRQRRARTPSANDTNTTQTSIESNSPTRVMKEEQSIEQQVLPDLLPPQTFRLAESSSLFSQISLNPQSLTEHNQVRNNSNNLPKNKSGENHAQMVEIKAKNIQNDKMSVQNIELEPHIGEIVDTVNILESVEPFVPEYVETVQIIDLSEDSDSSMRIDADGKEVRRSKSKRSLCESPKVMFNEEVELRPEANNTSTPILRVEKQRISFEEKRKRMENERDILRDSEEECDDDSKDTELKQPKAKRWRQLKMTVEIPTESFSGLELERNSFYNADKETNFDVEPLVFSDDEEIPRFSMEMTPTFDSDSDTSRMETPSNKKSDSCHSKVLPNSTSIDDSNITLQSPDMEVLSSNVRMSDSSLEQRVNEFEKMSKYIIRKLETTKELIENCPDGETAVEDLKLIIAPDAATLISQGDSLVLETHGKQGSVSRLVMKTQIILREKFREVQQSKSKVPEVTANDDNGETSSPRSTLEKLSIKGINVEELVCKGLKRINDLIEKPVDHNSIDELERRLTEVNDRRDDLKLIVNAIGKSEQMPKINAVMMDDIEKSKNNLMAHSDIVELALTALKNDSRNGAASDSKDYNEEPSGTGALAGSFDKSVLQISDWLNWEQNMIKIQSVAVDDVDAVRMAIEKQEKVLRELKLKKPQLNELVHTAEVLKGDVKRQQLQEKDDYENENSDEVTRLREHWDETSQCVLQRAAQLKNMLGDSQRYEAKRLELEKWLGRMEVRAERMGTVATTADVLEAQQKEQKSFHAELHQNKQQFEMFNVLTQKLIAVYPSDDTTRIKKMTEAINLRYSNLNNGVISRGKQLNAAVHSLQSFDRAMDQFLAFLSESESLCESAESEIDRNPLMFKDLQSEIETHRVVYDRLDGTGRKLLGSLTSQEDAVMLQRRLDEMNQRWNNLKSKSIAIRNRLESNSEHWNALLLSLRELTEWVIRKDTELSTLGMGPVRGDAASLQKQLDDHKAFRRQLEDKRPIVESNLLSGRQYIASEPPVSDNSDTEAAHDSDSRYMSAEEQSRELTRSIRREVNKLSEQWNNLIDRSDSWKHRLDEYMTAGWIQYLDHELTQIFAKKEKPEKNE